MYSVKDFNKLMGMAVDEEEPKKKKLPLNRLFEMPAKKPDGYKNTKSSESKKVKQKKES